MPNPNPKMCAYAEGRQLQSERYIPRQAQKGADRLSVEKWFA